MARGLRRDDDAEIGQRLNALRKAKGLSLLELAKATGVSESTLSRIENGRTPISARHLFQVAETLGIDIAEFFESPGRSNARRAGRHLGSRHRQAAGTAGEAHQASIVINREARAVFRFMSDPAKLNCWSFGTWKTEIAADGLVLGSSLFDGTKTFVRIDADTARLAVDYHLGQEPKSLVPRIAARIVPGQRLGLADSTCVLTLVAWRAASMNGDRWQRLTVSHEFEVVLIKNLLENARV
jgi:transcriptional regulator with XRE-family HTH domain